MGTSKTKKPQRADTNFTGQAQYWQNMYDDALETIEKILEADSRHVEAWNIKANALYKLDRHEAYSVHFEDWRVSWI